MGKVKLSPILILQIMILFLGIFGGCAQLDLRGKGFSEDTNSRIFRQFRHDSPQEPSSAFSNKARQIERNLGFD